MSMEDQQHMLPQDDVLFMGTLHIMLAAVLRAVQQYEHAEGKLPTMQELREQTLQLADPQELFYTLLAEAYSEAKASAYEQFRRDYDLALNRFLALYERDQSVIRVLALFVEDASPSQRVRFVELLRSAYFATKLGVQGLPEEENERNVYEIFLALFHESKEE